MVNLIRPCFRRVIYGGGSILNVCQRPCFALHYEVGSAIISDVCILGMGAKNECRQGGADNVRFLYRDPIGIRIEFDACQFLGGGLINVVFYGSRPAIWNSETKRP